jgi:hypothetical protein
MREAYDGLSCPAEVKAEEGGYVSGVDLIYYFSLCAHVH